MRISEKWLSQLVGWTATLFLLDVFAGIVRFDILLDTCYYVVALLARYVELAAIDVGNFDEFAPS